MADRLSPLDVSFLYLESPTTAMHVGGVAIFAAPADGVDIDALVRLINTRVGAVRRYRQKVRWVPGRLANPVWVDDPDFDLGYHVRRSALPRPGTEAQLRELVARIMARHLDRSRPLWELYLVEGLVGNRFAILTKTHHAMVDGVSAVDIGQLILDASPAPGPGPGRPADPDPAAFDDRPPAREPSGLRLVAGAVTDLFSKPTEVLDTLRGGAHDAHALAVRTAGTLGGLLAATRTAVRPPPPTPLNVPIGAARRYGMARTELDDYKRVRKAHGGTVNDVVLATVAGALRGWMLTRGEAVTTRATLRAMVPVSVRSDAQAGQLGNRISAYFVDLPVGEPDPVMRLHQVRHAMSGHKEAGQSVGAEAIVALSGFAPPTLHALGARVAAGFTRRLFNLVVSNVPGPQFPLYAAGAPMLAAFPVVPLAKGQAVSVGLTSYNGGVFYGLNGDRDAMPDIDVLAALLEESLAELVGTVR